MVVMSISIDFTRELDADPIAVWKRAFRKKWISKIKITK